VMAPSVSTNITFTATVTDATSGVKTVTINLSSIGGSATQAMLTAGGGIYTANITATIATEGTYTLTVTATDYANTPATKDITLVVSIDIVPPVITSPAITYLYGLTSVPPGGTVTISANVTDNVPMVGGQAGVTAACTALVGTPISLTKGVGNIWAGIATVKEGMKGDYTVTITAKDAKGNEATPKTLTLTVVSGATGYKLTLVKGWNLISLPIIPNSTNITTIISAANLASGNVSSIGIVRAYDPATGTFPRYTPATGSGDLVKMADGCGYWVFMDSSDNLTVTGREWPAPPEVPPTYNVVVGWNLIGFKSLSSDNDTHYLANIAGTYPVLWSFNAVTGAYSNVKGVNLGMEVGHGFWLWVTTAGTIVPPQ